MGFPALTDHTVVISENNHSVTGRRGGDTPPKKKEKRKRKEENKNNNNKNVALICIYNKKHWLGDKPWFKSVRTAITGIHIYS